MRRRSFGVLFMALAALATSRPALAAVSLSSSNSAPSLGASDQYNLVDDQQIPGGMTPGGGTFNSQSYSDNGGPPGQTFTTPSAPGVYQLCAVSLLGTGDFGGGSTSGNWAIRVSSVSGANLTPLATVTGIAGPASAGGNDWLTLAFTGGDVLGLNAGAQYAFEVWSQDGWYGFGGALDSAYLGGTAFNNAGSSRAFTDNTLGNLANHGYDRAFHVSLNCVPEPAVCSLALIGMMGLLATRRSR
jgi:hypothetical protein